MTDSEQLRSVAKIHLTKSNASGWSSAFVKSQEGVKYANVSLAALLPVVIHGLGSL